MSNAYTCPHCGSRITPFAAGCAYCGADLDVLRDRSPSLALRLRGAWLARRRRVPPASPRVRRR